VTATCGGPWKSRDLKPNGIPENFIDNIVTVKKIIDGVETEVGTMPAYSDKFKEESLRPCYTPNAAKCRQKFKKKASEVKC
jgi:hypothetical protein